MMMSLREDRYYEGDGPWQDGGLIFHFSDENRWIALFTAFHSQSFHTDDVTGHRIYEACDEPAADGRVRIVAALFNLTGHDKGLESVIILNITPKSIDLKGWMLVDSEKKKAPLSGILKAGQKVHGVSYTAKDAAKEGWTIVFQKSSGGQILRMPRVRLQINDPSLAL